MQRWTAAGCLIGAVATATTIAPAAQLVLFEDGRSIRAMHVEVQDGFAVLTMEGGGRIAVPRQRVRSWSGLADELEPISDEQELLVAPWRKAAGEYAGLIDRVATEHGIDPALLTAMALVESAFDPQAISPRGALGLLQLMPATAERFGVVDVFDAGENLQGGARYLNWLLARYAGRTDLALAGYNAGEGAVDRHRGIPPYSETEAYVSKVLHGAASLAATAP